MSIKPLAWLDNWLNGITMYRLILYYLIVLVGGGLVASAIHWVNFSPWELAASTLLLLAASWISQRFFAQLFHAVTNLESVYISALILALIISPAKTWFEVGFLIWAAVLTTASKYLLNIGNKHLFNPVAIAVVLTALVSQHSASWWIGTSTLFPLVAVGGLLIARKVRREDMVFTFLATLLVASSVMTLWAGNSLLKLYEFELFHSATFFFAFVMLTEPLTAPATHRWQLIYAALVGILFMPSAHLGQFFFTPELALVVGNLLAYLVSPRSRLVLNLTEKIQLTPDTVDFLFKPNQPVAYTPGQYVEWTLPVTHPDNRGNRRYLTLASAPTEPTLRIGVKFYAPPSQFKQLLLSLSNQTPVVATQFGGDFVLPADPHRKLAFLAGGIGITPFRSMVKYLTDTKQTRDITLLYSNKKVSEIVYQDVFTEAQKAWAFKPVYVLTDVAAAPGWPGEIGRIDAVMIQRQIPDYLDRQFYLSGPHTMVTAFEQVLRELKVPSHQIKTDFFPGFA